MIDRIWAIALNTYREAVRQKILYTLLFFAIALILFSLFLGQLTLGANLKIVKDMGLFSIMLFGALTSIFVGIGLVFREVERRTVYTVLSKPVTRYEFILGKFFGLAITVALQTAAMTALWYGLMCFYPEPLDPHLLKAVLLIYAELCILIALTLVFSSYSSSFMSMLFCLSILVLGHLTDDFAAIVQPKAAALLKEGQGTDILVGHMFNTVAWLMEVFNLDHFVINAQVVHGVSVSMNWVIQGWAYAVCWLVLLLGLAIFLFARKDLK